MSAFIEKENIKIGLQGTAPLVTEEKPAWRQEQQRTFEKGLGVAEQLTADEVPMESLSGAASSTPLSLPMVSASNYLTVLPAETEFDSKAQAVVHGSVDAVTERDSTTFEAIEKNGCV